MMLKWMVLVLLVSVFLLVCVLKFFSKDEVQVVVYDVMKDCVFVVDGVVWNFVVGVYDCVKEGDGFICIGS